MTSDTAPAPALTGARLTDSTMRAALDRLDPRSRLVCGYHLGLWDAEGRSTSGGGGKGIRGTLALLSAEAAGASVSSGVPAAVACELVHNFSLLHDDLIDGDTERRHRRTVWAQFGSPSAILSGDVLLSLANEMLAEADSPTVGWALRCLNATVRRLVTGQVADLEFERREDVGLEECRRMAADKTGALLACSASLGAVLADAPADLATGLAAFGEHLGMAFQLVDDLLGIWGDPSRTGKPTWSDLRARKKSLPVVAALEGTSPASQRLRRLYADPELPEERLEELAVLVAAAGGRAWAERTADAESTAALDVLDRLDLPGRAHAGFADLTRRLSRRDY